MKENSEEIKKDKECLHCKKFFECEGKPKGITCLHIKKIKEGEEYRWK